MTKENLKSAIEDLKILEVDRRSTAQMTKRLSGARRASVHELLKYLSATQLRQVCSEVGLETTGTKESMISRLRLFQTTGESNVDSVKPAVSEPHQDFDNDSKSPGSSALPSNSGQVTKLELIWPGKYDEEGSLNVNPRIALPFQVIEAINESRATRESPFGLKQSLYNEYQGTEGDSIEDGWKNKLIWGDNLLVMESLLGMFSGKIDLIYIDPPFATGANFSYKALIGERSYETVKEPSILEEKAYRDTWGQGYSSYLQMIMERITLMRELLSEHGSLYVHLDATVVHYVKPLLDEVFGHDSFQREIVWRIGWISGYKSQAKNWIRNHDTILYYVRNPDSFTFNKEYVPYAPDYVRRDGSKPSGKGYPIEDVWNANSHEFDLTGADSLDSIQIKSFSAEKTGYDTQKNESLIRRIVNASSNPGDLVADFFCGSGTTLVAAENLGRRWIGCDLGRWGIHVTRKRLLDIANCKPFEILNLGKYERQYWQGALFNKAHAETNIYEYLFFILTLYGAEPVTGLKHIHGHKGKALVHVGAVDAPVTIDEILNAINECSRLRHTELHLLGWEWEMGVASGNSATKGGLMQAVARDKGVKLVMLSIPREVMDPQSVKEGDIRFFELAYMDARVVNVPRTRNAFQVVLNDFVVPNPEFIPHEVQSSIRNWSDYIDYWSVDWDFQNDTFVQGWVTYRTRNKRRLELKTARHYYDIPGNYNLLVKVIDVFGNDTSKLISLEVD